MKPSDVLQLVQDQLLPDHSAERNRLDKIDAWYRWEQEDLKVPARATWEQRELVRLAKTPWLGLVVTSLAQTMFVDGYRTAGVEGMAGPWATWNANDMDARQIPLHRAALGYGYSFQTIMPGTDSLGKRAVMRGISPRDMWAVYQNPAADDWPMYSLHKQGSHYYFMDEEARHVLGTENGKLVYIEPQYHNVGLCPVVRFANMLDLEGRADGEVEPFIGVAARINKTEYDRLLTQHYNSWKVRTATGIDLEGDDSLTPDDRRLKLAQSDMLVAGDPDVTFGTLAETPLGGFIDAYESDLEALAAVTQTPSHNLTGKMVNLSAEALAAARAGLMQKSHERQTSFGKSHAQSLRLAAYIEGDESASADVAARVTWQDMEVRSLAQAVDALGKAATMLQIPVQALWGRIPGVTKNDTDDWSRMAPTPAPAAVAPATNVAIPAPASTPAATPAVTPATFAVNGYTRP